MAITKDIALLSVRSVQGGSGGSGSYSDLSNKPSINGHELSGNKTSAELGINPLTAVYDSATENLSLS